jgi:exodeoxyribonuclease VII small subunit
MSEATEPRATKREAPGETYSAVVGRLESIVASLESGNLSLEDALERFAEGVRLVKRGEAILGQAEKRVEQLLSEDGKTAALDVGQKG